MNFQAESELVEQVDQLAREMGYVDDSGKVNRSAAIRHVLRQAVGVPAARSTIIEEANEVYARIAEAQGRIYDRVLDVIREEIFVDVGPPAVTALEAGSRDV